MTKSSTSESWVCVESFFIHEVSANVRLRDLGTERKRGTESALQYSTNYAETVMIKQQLSLNNAENLGRSKNYVSNHSRCLPSNLDENLYTVCLDVDFESSQL